MITCACRLPAYPPRLHPTLDDLADAEIEAEGLIAIQAAVELFAVLESARVVDLDLVAGLGGLAGADLSHRCT